MVKSSPGVSPKPRFGPNLDSTVVVIVVVFKSTQGTDTRQENTTADTDTEKHRHTQIQ